jgi:hypothetical protein
MDQELGALLNQVGNVLGEDVIVTYYYGKLAEPKVAQARFVSRNEKVPFPKIKEYFAITGQQLTGGGNEYAGIVQ